MVHGHCASGVCTGRKHTISRSACRHKQLHTFPDAVVRRLYTVIGIVIFVSANVQLQKPST